MKKKPQRGSGIQDAEMFFEEEVMKTYEELYAIDPSNNYNIDQYIDGSMQHCKSFISNGHGDTVFCSKEYIGRYQGVCPDCLAQEITRRAAWQERKKETDNILADMADISHPAIGSDGRVYFPAGMVTMYRYSYDFYYADKRFSPNFTRPMPAGLIPDDRIIVASTTNDSNVFCYLFTLPSGIVKKFEINKISRKVHNGKWIYFSLLDGEQEWM
jgi:hypothetical protein